MMPDLAENVKAGRGGFPMFFRPPCTLDRGEEYPPVPQFPKPGLRSFPCDQSRPSKVRRSLLQNQRMKSATSGPRPPKKINRVLGYQFRPEYGRGARFAGLRIRNLISWGFPRQ